MYAAIPCLVWAWVSWARNKERFQGCGWRGKFAFAGLLIISLGFVMAAWCLVHFGDRDWESFIQCVRINFFISGFGVLASIGGRGRVRFPLCLSALGLQAFYVLSVILR
jgi:hypothetical protein